MRNIWNFLKEKWAILVKVIFLFAISFLYLGRALNGIEPYPTGDGHEYILTTEAIRNHFSPDIRVSDVKSFKESYTKRNEWTANYKYAQFDQTEAYLAYPDRKFRTEFGGIYKDKWGKDYGYHFFFYSALNVPGRLIADVVKSNPMRCFQVTNAMFIIITCFILLFFTPFSLWRSILIVLAFAFSTGYWYLGWIHTEVYTVCLVTLGFWFFLQKRHYLGIFLVAMAGLQNQPLLAMVLFMGLGILIERGFNWKNIIKTALCSVIITWPPLFYLIHFDTTNLIKDTGFLSTEFITYTRILGFYVDINQGVILAIPLVLFAYLLFVGRKWVRFGLRKESFDYMYLLPVFLVGMTCIVSTMGNWNHGQAVVNRYASWFSAIILIHTLFIAGGLREMTSLVLLNYIFMTQTFTVLYHDADNLNDWSQDHHKPLAKWVLENHPELYNPDPAIFIVRTIKNSTLGPETSPVFYIKNGSQITKFIVHKERVDNLDEFGFTKQEIERLKPTLHYVNNWAYVNEGEFTTNKTGGEIAQLVRERRIRGFENKIRSHPDWFKQVEEKAKVWGVPTAEALRRDADYLVTLEDEENSKR